MPETAEVRSLRTGFLRHVQKSPGAPALVVRAATKSYGELNRTASVWAQAVQQVAARRPERVGVFAYRSEISYTGALAALLAGAAFVPLNPGFPPEKIAGMIGQADLQAIIVDNTGADKLPQVARHGVSLPPLLLPESDSPSFEGVAAPMLDRTQIGNCAALQKLPNVASEDIAYLLFTSGSTGKPKGVPVTHGNVLHFMDVMSERYGIRPDDRFSQTFDQTFDLSVFDLFLAWSNGACVFSMSPIELLAPTKFINRNALTVWFSVPSLPANMIRRNTLTPGSLPTLRWSLFCGEPLPGRTAELWQVAAPNSMVENLYGPTELTVACFLHRWNPQTSPARCYHGTAPIGVPYPGLQAILVDENLDPVAPGAFGELLVAGPQTTPGYWRDPEKTAERYVTLPTSDGSARRFYRTGDRVACQDGEYIFAGRIDNQLKVLGHRVELGEIEAALRRNPQVEHAIACGWPIQDGSAHGIVCFVSGDSLGERALIRDMKAALPPYAVPSRIFIIPELPVNANGKLDRRALQERIPAMLAS